jgi:hypothetical protein
MIRQRKGNRADAQLPEELTARIVSYQQAYFIGWHRSGDDRYADDEASIAISAIIEHISSRHRNHAGQAVSILLLQARRYRDGSSDSCPCFGSLTLNGQTRSVLVYLPSDTFWALPSAIKQGVEVIELSFERLLRGFEEIRTLSLTSQPTSVSEM